MAEEAAEVRVKLVVDTAGTAKMADDMAKALKGAESGAKGAQAAASGVTAKALAMGQVMGTFAVEAAHKLMEVMKETFEAPLEAIRESEAQVKKLAGSFVLLDSSGKDFKQITDYARSVKNELSDMGIVAGVSGDELVDVFNNAVERGAKSVEQAQELTKSMAMAGKAVPGGAMALSSAFEQIEMGIVKAKNPLVGMIAATHVLPGNAKQVAAAMQKMTPTEQIEMAEKAIKKMGDKMKNAPMTLDQAMTSMKAIGGNILEEAGTPILKGLTKMALEVRSAFVNADGSMTEVVKLALEVAGAFGEMRAKSMQLVGPFVQGFVGGLTEGSEFVLGIWKEIFGGGNKMSQSMIDMAKSVGHLLGEAVKGAAFVVGAFVKAQQATFAAMEEAIGRMLMAVGKILPGLPKITDAGHTLRIAAQSKERESILDDARKGNISTEEARGFHSKLRSSDEDQKILESAIAQGEMLKKKVAAAAESSATDMAQPTIDAINMATDLQSTSQLKQIAMTANMSEAMAKQIGESTELIDGALPGFLAVLRKTGMETQAAMIESYAKPKIGPTGGPTNVFTGPINIKQDFRDQDPDRIAIIFREDLAKNASNRLSSGRAAGF